MEEPNKRIEDVKIEVVNNNEKEDIKLEVTNNSNSNEDLSAKTIVVPVIKEDSKEEAKEIDESDKKVKGKTYEVENISENVRALVDNYVQKAEKSEKTDRNDSASIIEKTEENNPKKARRKINVEEELFKIGSSITYDYSKIIGDLDYSKIKSYRVKDGDKTISFLFYENDFYAVNRINYKDGYMYSEKEDYLPVSENLNKAIRKIPNVAKARNILHIENIEARIYDMTDYILLLEREKIRVIKVSASGSLSEMKYKECHIDKNRLEEEVDKLAVEEEIKIREENSIKNRLKGFRNTLRKCVVNPIKSMLAKIGLVNDVKMLSDGKHSIFEKKI